MGDMLRFVVDIPADELADILRLDEAEEDLAGGVSPQMLADALKRAIIAGFEEYLGEEIVVSVRPVRSTPSAT
jgi:hypothetical protein